MINNVIYEDNKIILPDIKSKSIDLILTDPPYKISRDSNFKIGDKTGGKYKGLSNDFGDWDKEDLDWLFLLQEFKRVLRPGGKLIMFFDVWKMGFIKDLAENFKFQQPRIGVWVKNNPVPINSKYNYLSNSKEYFISLTKAGYVNKQRAKSIFNSEYDKAIYECATIAGKEVTGHPTQKPLLLIEELIKKHSNEGDLILDPFIGSGTTGVCCSNLNRKFIGIENNKDYIDICKSRGLEVISI